MLSKLVLLASTAAGHIIMHSPPAYLTGGVTNAPLQADGSDFPCRMTNWAPPAGLNTDLTLGSSGNTLQLQGSAVHGGGSCQLSITYDSTPSKSSTWKVIQSYEGGCPIAGQAGNLPANPENMLPPFQYSVPDNIPAGKAVLAWSWFNKIGNREFYMNCAPITLQGSGGSQANYDALPNMFEANIPQAGTCAVTEGTEIAFPNPGSNVVKAAGVTLGSPTGTCPAGSGSGSSSSSSSGAAPAAAAVVSPASTAAAAASSSSTTAAAATGTAGVFAQQPQASASAAPATPSAAPATSSGSGGCSPDGIYNCIGGSSFSICDHGSWTAPEAVAPGTTCQAGQGPTLTISKVKRHARDVKG